MASNRRYTWNFSVGGNFTEVSSVAETLEEARTQIMSRLDKIAVAKKEYDETVTTIRKQINDCVSYKDTMERLAAITASFDVDFFLGCFTTKASQYTRELVVYTWPHDKEMYLGELITTTEPKVSTVHSVSIRNSDGCVDR